MQVQMLFRSFFTCMRYTAGRVRGHICLHWVSFGESQRQGPTGVAMVRFVCKRYAYNGGLCLPTAKGSRIACDRVPLAEVTHVWRRCMMAAEACLSDSQHAAVGPPTFGYEFIAKRPLGTCTCAFTSLWVCVCK